jgi:aspartate/glutamate racemase
MKKVGLISVTLNAVNPMMRLLSQKTDSFEVLNYLDEGLQKLVDVEGRLTDKSISRMIALIGKAANDGAEIVLLTCTVFSPLVDRFNTLFSIPIISVDGAMLDEAVRMNKSTAILCTFSATVQTSLQIFEDAAKWHGINPKVDVFLLEEAMKAIKSGNKTDHDRIIAEKAEELSDLYDLIVLAQISMSEAKSCIKNCTKPVLTSPESAIKALEKEAEKMN